MSGVAFPVVNNVVPPTPYTPTSETVQVWDAEPVTGTGTYYSVPIYREGNKSGVLIANFDQTSGTLTGTLQLMHGNPLEADWVAALAADGGVVGANCLALLPGLAPYEPTGFELQAVNTTGVQIVDGRFTNLASTVLVLKYVNITGAGVVTAQMTTVA